MFPMPLFARQFAARIFPCFVVFGLLLLMVGCETTGEEKPTRQDEARQRSYYAQHIVMSGWVTRDNGAMQLILTKVPTLEYLEEIPQYASLYDWAEVKVSWFFDPELPGIGLCAFTFPEPSEPPLCYASIAVFGAETKRYITLEKTYSMQGYDIAAMVGEWTQNGNRANLGPRNYTDTNSFAKDVFAMLKRDGTKARPRPEAPEAPVESSPESESEAAANNPSPESE